MRNRIAIMLGLVVIRILFDFVSVVRWEMGKMISVTGNVDKIDHKKTECVVVVGVVWGKKEGYCEVNKGDRIRMVGRVESRLIDRLLGRIWVESARIYTIREVVVKPSGVVWWRERMVEVYRKLLPEPEASLVAGIVLGFKSDLGKTFREELINSGTIHIVVASGYNVMVVGSVGLGLLLYLFRRRLATVFVIVIMVLYGLLAGGEPPIWRAVLMGGLLFIGQSIGRGNQSSWTLFLVAWAMVMFEPELLTNISFQLTVAASMGLMVVSPVVERWLEGRGLASWVLRIELVPTFSAMCLTAPIIWWNFGRLSFVGLVSNLFVLPLVPMLMMSGGVMLILGMVWLPLGWVMMPIVYTLAHAVVLLIKLFG